MTRPPFGGGCKHTPSQARQASSCSTLDPIWPASSGSQKRQARLADEVVARYGVDIVFRGTGSEVPYIDAFRNRMCRNSDSLAGQTTLPQLVVQLHSAWLRVCVDSATFELTWRSCSTPQVS